MVLSKNLIRLSWADYDKATSKIYAEVNAYLKKQKISIDLIVPVFRGGVIPSISLSFKFNVLRFMPAQYKYFHTKLGTTMKKLLDISSQNLIGFDKKDPTILIVEGNYASGKLVGKVVSDVRAKFPSSKIILVSLTRDYFYKDFVKTDFSAWGILTNEEGKLSKAECEKQGIKFGKIYLFPWENEKEELAMLNKQEYSWVV